MPQFYLDSPNFATATAVYANATLTVLAPDGYYSSNGIVRSQVGGQLSAYAECESCKGHQKPVEGELLLDLYPGAVAAFSLNQLSTPYTGAAVRVRRASDSVEQDIGFTSEFVLDVAALDSFCSGTDGFVVTWYDQAGANDATQTTTGNQPKIYDASTGVELENAVEALFFNGIDDRLISPISISQPLTTFAVTAIRAHAAGVNYIFDSDNTNVDRVFVGSNTSNNWRYSAGITRDTTTPAPLSQVLLSISFNGANSEFWQNGVSISTNNPGTNGMTDLYIGAKNDGLFGVAGTLQLMLVYAADKSADRAGIENALNQQYNIYWDGTVTALLDDYPGAVGAFSVRALNSFYTGPIMRVRRSSDSAEQDIKALYSGDLDTAAIAAFCAGTDGFVVTWYNQDGSGNDATQGTNSRQPKIYDASTGIIEQGGLPSVLFTTFQTIYHSLASNLTGDMFFAGVFSKFGTTSRVDISNDPWIRYNNNGTTLTNEPLFASTGLSYLSGRHLVTFQIKSTGATFSENGALSSEYAGGTSVNMSRFQMNADFATYGGSTNAGTTYWQAYAIYNADKSADRAAIETRINDYFNIY